jgi:hypothetical protein
MIIDKFNLKYFFLVFSKFDLFIFIFAQIFKFHHGIILHILIIQDFIFSHNQNHQFNFVLHQMSYIQFIN